MKQYDAIIIGGGLSGLVCAVTLSKEGMRVCVLEQHSRLGGCLQSFYRDNYTLDTGMHYVGSLSEGQIMHQCFKYFGVIDSLKLRKLDEKGFDVFIFNDGTKYVHAMGYENFINTLAQNFPDERQGISQLCRSMKNVGDLISIEVLRNGKISKGGFDYMSLSAYDEICSNIKNPTLRNVLSGNCSLFAGSKETSSFYEYGMITHSNIEGAHCFVNGSQQLADALVFQIKNNGGEVLTNAKVSKIRLDGNKVDYVETDNGEYYSATYVISSVHPWQTFTLLDNNTVIKKAFFSRLFLLNNTYGLFSTYLLLKPESVVYENHNTYMFNTSDVWSINGDWHGVNIPTTLLCMQPNINSKYTNVITLLTPMPFAYCKKWANTRTGKRGSEYQEFKEMFSEAVIDFVSQYYPILKHSIYKIYTASPLTFRDYTFAPNGSAYGLIKDFHNPMVSLIPIRTKVENLLLTGQNMNIHGCIGTTISAITTCAEILGNEYLSKKIGNA